MSQDISLNNSRIAKNTLALYCRTFVTMIVGLYTSRIMLQALGVEDYGINNVVGGIVGMTSLITGTMSQAISRYLTFSLGKGNIDKLRIMFSTSVNAQIVLSLIVAVILEVVGVWFLTTKANIPIMRMTAAHWVLQFSILSLFIRLVSSPYNALIVAHERMSIYAYMSVVDALISLGICFAIDAYRGDRLILLSFLTTIVALSMRIFYGLYCNHCFKEAKYSIKTFDRDLLKELVGYTGWNMLGGSVWVLNSHGINILLNLFFGVVFNASRGIANTVNGAVQNFIGGFTTAFTPQITKSYAVGDIGYAISLANRGTKFTWLMMFVFIVPICMETDLILKLWLGEVPEMASLFLRLALFESLAVQSGETLVKLIRADGNIKSYQIMISLMLSVIFPLSWCAYALGAPVWSAYVIYIVVSFASNMIRYHCLKKLMQFSIIVHFKECIIPCLWVSVASFILPLIICAFMDDSITRFVIMVPISVASVLACSYFFGLSKGEREFVMAKVEYVAKKYIKNY